jgi:hypothetical protein
MKIESEEIKMRSELKKYIEAKTLSVCSLFGGYGLECVGIENGIDDYIIIRDHCKTYTKEGVKTKIEIHKYKIYYDTNRAYFKYRNGLRYHLDEFLMV